MTIKMRPKLKYKLIKTLETMITKIVYGSLWVAMVLALMVLVSPVLLIFSTGQDGEMTIWNLVGIVWLLLLVCVFNYADKRWIKK